jgi:hypothetical protein
MVVMVADEPEPRAIRQQSGHYQLRGWQSFWYGRVARNPVVFYPLAWLDCSVPLTRGRLGHLYMARFQDDRRSVPNEEYARHCDRSASARILMMDYVSMDERPFS